MDKNWRTIIVDDELLARQRMKRLLSDFPNNLITYEIYNETNYRIAKGLIRQNERFTELLKQGEYKFIFSTPENRSEFTRMVDKISNFEFPLTNLKYVPKIYGIVNGTQINSQSGQFYLTNLIGNEVYKVFLDNSLQSYSNFRFGYNLALGTHEIIIRNSNNIILSRTTFVITNEKIENIHLKYKDFLSLMLYLVH